MNEDGRLIFDKTTDEQREVRRVELEKIKQMIETHCECKSSVALAELPPDKREVYEEVVGFHNVEV